jgi:hypothetical protein
MGCGGTGGDAGMREWVDSGTVGDAGMGWIGGFEDARTTQGSGMAATLGFVPQPRWRGIMRPAMAFYRIGMAPACCYAPMWSTA